jgi:tRNA pseudouridine55 synthase
MNPTSVNLHRTRNPLIVWKNSGETLDQLLDRVRLEYGINTETKMTYAGRLDPLAHGIMIILTGDAVHDKELYNKLDKRYRATVVLGFETDTYDVVGISSCLGVTEVREGGGISLKEKEKNTTPAHTSPPLRGRRGLEQFLTSQIGTHTQTYPPYSSKNVDGVPLWKLARDGNLPEVMPSREITVHTAEIIDNDTSLSGENLLIKIHETVSRVTGDFRQEEILASWEKNIDTEKSYQVLEIDYHVGSGTYIRGLVHELGQQLGTGAVLIGLERYQVGNYKKSDIL